MNKMLNGVVIAMTDEEIAARNAITAKFAAEEAANGWSRAREDAYALLNQDEMRYDDIKNSTTTWVDAIDAIKAAHPKP